MESGSRPSSATVYDVEDGGRQKLRETDPHRLEQRQKAIDKGKNSRAYHHYIKAVPKERRPSGTSEDEKRFPRTPDKYEIASKRGWEGKLRAWRLRLHQYNPEPKEGEEVIKIPTAMSREKRYALQEPSDSGASQGKKRERDAESNYASKRKVPAAAKATALETLQPLTEDVPSAELYEVGSSTAVPEGLEVGEKKASKGLPSIYDHWSDEDSDDIGL